MVAKKPPFEGSVSSVMRKHIKGELPSPKLHNPNVPDAIVRIIERMCKKDPKERFATCDELFEDLELVKLKERTGQNLDVEKSDLVEVLQLEKAKSLESQIEKLEVVERLKRMTMLFMLASALWVVTLAIAFYLLMICAKHGFL
jgi:serine/threonine-protein kinase